ncbi:hypothetical protein CIB84_010846 [Bambusicola thoracicus]|uniref:Uncharacterized protein n=1 Tax=Bambusicola thoracicus TaxID=9083 RepID=A0A2P4SMU9_BAMTH|nr:hypothetical protein CIB84_010846 [Bambusicola thoracicus]
MLFVSRSLYCRGIGTYHLQTNLLSRSIRLSASDTMAFRHKNTRRIEGLDSNV